MAMSLPATPLLLLLPLLVSLPLLPLLMMILPLVLPSTASSSEYVESKESQPLLLSVTEAATTEAAARGR